MGVGKPQQRARDVKRLRRTARELIALSNRLANEGRRAVGWQEAMAQLRAEDPEFAGVYANVGANLRWSEALAMFGIYTPDEVEDDDKKLTLFIGRELRSMLIRAAELARTGGGSEEAVAERVIESKKAKPK